jgi:hypothetical protein
MSDYMVHTEVNHFEGWLGNEHDLNTLEEARAEMLRQEKVIRADDATRKRMKVLEDMKEARP